MPGPFPHASSLPPAGITKFVAAMIGSRGREEPSTPTVPYEHHTPVDEVAGTFGSLSPAVGLLEIVGPGFGEQVAGTASPDELFENLSRHALDEIRAIDPAELREFIAGLIESLREQAPDGIGEFVADLLEFWGHEKPSASTASYKFDTPVDEVSDTSGSVTPEVALLQMTGSGSGEELEIGEQIAAINLPDGLIEQLSSLRLADIHAIDPIEVKEFVGNLIESLSEHAPEGVKEFFDHLIEFFGLDEPVAPAHSNEFGTLFDEFTDNWGALFPAAGLLEIVGSGFGEDGAAAMLPDELINAADGFWHI